MPQNLATRSEGRFKKLLRGPRAWRATARPLTSNRVVRAFADGKQGRLPLCGAFSIEDAALIRTANRFGFAVLLAYLRFLGRVTDNVFQRQLASPCLTISFVSH